MDEIVFRDENFENLIRKKLGIYDRPINTEDVKRIKDLYINGEEYREGQSVKTVKDVSDLRYFTELESLGILNVDFPNQAGIFTNCTRISNLTLQNCGKVDLSEIYNLKDCTNLSIKNCQLENQDRIGQLSEMEDITLSNCNLKSLQFCSSLEKVESIYASDNELVNLEGLEGKQNLSRLVASNNKLIDASALRSNVNVVNLDLSSNNLNGNIDFIENMSAIENLNLSRNAQITDISKLAACKSCKRVYLSEMNNVTDFSSIAEMPNLEGISLRDCNISNIDFLTNHTLLKELDITDNQELPGKEVLIRVFNNNPNLTKLYFDNTAIYNELSETKVDFDNKEFERILTEHNRGEVSIPYGENQVSEAGTILIRDMYLKKATILDGIENFNSLKRLFLDEIPDFQYSLSDLENLNGLQNLEKVFINVKNIDYDTAKRLSEKHNNYQFFIGKTYDKIMGEKYGDTYTLDQFIKIEESIKELTDSIDPNWSDIEKARYVYQKIGEFVEYDYNGCQDKYSPEELNSDFARTAIKSTRNLYGTLVEGKGVCAGFSEAYAEIMNRIGNGIECRGISGYVPGIENGYHRWQAVKLDDQWYYCDLTLDLKNIKIGKELEYFGKSEITMRKDHTLDSTEKSVEAKEDLSLDKIAKAEQKLGITNSNYKERLNDLHNSINPEWNELQKLRYIYQNLGNVIDFEKVGKSAVADVFIEAMRDNGIKCGKMNGYMNQNRELLHNWTAVGIDEKIYYCDIYTDRKNIQNNQELKCFCRGEASMSKNYTAFSSLDVKIEEQDIPGNKIKKAEEKIGIANNSQTEDKNSRIVRPQISCKGAYDERY